MAADYNVISIDDWFIDKTKLVEASRQMLLILGLNQPGVLRVGD